MKKSEYFILTPSYQNAQKNTYTTVWPVVTTQKSINWKICSKSGPKSQPKIVSQINEIIEKIVKGIT